MLQRLRLPNARKGIAQNSFYQSQCPQRYLAICFDPVLQILTELGGKDCLALSPSDFTLLR
jgi:hypothetical protein